MQWPDRSGLRERRHAGVPTGTAPVDCNSGARAWCARRACVVPFFVLARSALTIFFKVLPLTLTGAAVEVKGLVGTV